MFEGDHWFSNKNNSLATFYCPNLGEHYWHLGIEARDAAKHPAINRVDFFWKNLSSPKCQLNQG